MLPETLSISADVDMSMLSESDTQSRSTSSTTKAEVAFRRGRCVLEVDSADDEASAFRLRVAMFLTIVMMDRQMGAERKSVRNL